MGLIGLCLGGYHNLRADSIDESWSRQGVRRQRCAETAGTSHQHENAVERLGNTGRPKESRAANAQPFWSRQS